MSTIIQDEMMDTRILLLRRTGANALDSDGLRALCAWGQLLFRRVELGVEKGVNERGFSKAGLAY